MKTYWYRDHLGQTYEVPEFERRRRILLKIAIVGQIIFLGAILYFSWFIAPTLH